MSYAKLDNLYDDVRKIRRAWRAHPPNPVGLHVMAITYCQRHRTDGCVPDEWIEDMVPNGRQRNALIVTMVGCSMLDDSPHDEGRYRVHDFLEHNESAAIRKERGVAAAKAARMRWARESAA